VVNKGVAIDGPVASGKTTAARAVAARLGRLYVDTGAMYRALTLAALQAGVDPGDGVALLRVLAATPIALDPDPAAPLGFRISYGGTEAGDELFGEAVSRAVSGVSAHAGVRTAMVSAQRAIAERGPVVMAGRDIGTVVLPGSACKVFLTASVAARVARRAAELAQRGDPVDSAWLRTEIERRDRDDSTRAVAPLRPAPDAWVLDSSDLTADQVVDLIVARARSVAP
jgi:cytidylate kinase